MAYKIQNPLIGSQPITEVSTTQKHALGTIVPIEDDVYGAGEAIYLRGAASVGRGDWVTYNIDDGSVTLLAANAIGPVAVAFAATVASTFGWYHIQGKAVGKCLALFADNANVYATATAGSIDDAVVAGDRVKRAKGASAIGTPAAGLAEFEIDRPFMDDAVAA
jgi:hypothetical protein